MEKEMDEKVQHELALVCVQLAQQIIEDDDPIEKTRHARKSKARQKSLQELLRSQSRPYLTFNDVTELLWQLYQSSTAQSITRQRVAQVFIDLASRRDLPFGDAVEAAHTLYHLAPNGSAEKQQAIQMLLRQAQWPGVTMKQSVEAILALCFASPLRSKERRQAIQVLLELAQRPGLSVEDSLTFITLNSEHMALIGSTPAWEKRELAIKKRMLLALALRPDLTSEQATCINEALPFLPDTV